VRSGSCAGGVQRGIARIRQSRKYPRNSFGMIGSFIEFDRTVKKFAAKEVVY
jgi:hypothetical protein